MVLQQCYMHKRGISDVITCHATCHKLIIPPDLKQDRFLKVQQRCPWDVDDNLTFLPLIKMRVCVEDQ